MRNKESETFDVSIEKIIWYSTYVDCLSRIINELIENGDDNLKPTDLPNLAELLCIYANKLYQRISELHYDLEFKN